MILRSINFTCYFFLAPRSSISIPFSGIAASRSNLPGRCSLSSTKKGTSKTRVMDRNLKKREKEPNTEIEVEVQEKTMNLEGEPGYVLDQRKYIMGSALGEMSLHSFNNIVSEDPHKFRSEVIERAWAISKIKEMVKYRTRLIEYYRSIRRAMEELEKTNKRLFLAASKPSETGEDFLYSRQIRLPTHSPDSATPTST